MDRKKIASLFKGWENTIILSYLQGHMGYAIVDQTEYPTAAQIVVGDFCFFAGTPNIKLVKKAAAPILIPKTEEWCQIIERVFGKKVKRTTRYSIKKEPDIFHRDILKKFVSSLPEKFVLKQIDRSIYPSLMREPWSVDLCSQFTDFEDFEKRGIGFVILDSKTPISGASSYIIYSGGIEIEIDTKSDYRRQGLACICSAKLILECLNKGLYPSWDAHDKRSVALAEKLGYHKDRAYPVYIMENFDV